MTTKSGQMNYLALGAVFFLFACIVSAPGLTYAATVGNQEVITVPINQGGSQQTQALLWLPESYASDDASTTYPLIIDLHGAGDAGTDINLLLNPGLLTRRIADGFIPQAVNPVNGQTYKFIVFSPQAPSWSYGYAQLQYMLPALEAAYRIDMNRIYVTGLSAGGYGTWTTITDSQTFAGQLAAIAPVSATALDSNQVSHLENAATNDVAVWGIVGDQDAYYGAAADYVSAINAANPSIPAILTPINGVGHSAWIEAFDPLWRPNGLNLYEWFLQYARNAAPNAGSKPSVTLTAPANNTAVVAPGAITLTASASAVGGSVAKVEFYSGTTLLGSDTSAPYSFSWSSVPTGVYGVFARAIDTDGTVSNSKTSYVTVLEHSGESMPFSGTPAAIPGKIEIENYDLGGPGIAYSDTTAVNSGNWYRPNDAVDTELTPNGADGALQYAIGWTAAGEWTKYTVDVAQSGSYTLQTRTGSPNGNSSLRLEVDGSPIATVTLPNTGNYETYQTKSTSGIQLTQGRHVIRVYDVTGGFNSNWINFILDSVSHGPSVSAGTAQTITLPQSSVTLSGNATDADGTITGYAWTQTAGPISAVIATPTAATTDVTGLSTAGTYTFTLSVTDDNGAVGSASVTVTVAPAAPASTPFSGTPAAIPGTVQFEAYDKGGQNVGYYDSTSGNTGGAYRSDSVDVENSADGTYDVGWTTDGEWLNYTIDVATAGTYSIQTRAATPNTGKSIEYSLDGAPLATVTLPNTGAWQTYQTVTTNGIALPAGEHILRATMHTGSASDAGQGFNLNYFTLTLVGNAAPTANAGAAQTITLPIDSATLSGSGSDSDGTIASYAWVQTDGPVFATIANPNAATTDVTGLSAAGTYTFTLTVTDNQGATGTATTSIMVAATPVNNAPTVSAGADQTITLPTDSISLSGEASDSDGTIASTLWTKLSGGAATIADASARQTNVTGLTEGVYVFQLTATDDDGAQASATVTITVQPVAPASMPYNGSPAAIPGTVQLENYDLGGQDVGYSDSTSGNSGGAYRSDNVDIETVLGGSVTDVGWTTDGEWLNYTVNVATTGNYSIAANIATPNAGKTITVQMDAVTVGTITTINTGWWQTYQTVTIDAVPLTAGQHVMKLLFATGSASDAGQGVNVDKLVFTLASSQEAQNAAPIISLAADGATVAPATVTLAATATDSDGAIATVDFYDGATLLGTATGAPYTYNASNLAAGTYSFTAKATDDDGAVATSNTVTVTVTDPEDPANNAYGGVPAAIPGTIQAEAYDLGGQGVAYYDTTSGNTGGAYRSDSVDVETAGGGVTDVGWTTNGEWLNYTVNVATDGNYKVVARVATPNTGKKIAIQIDGTTVGTITTSNTGWWQTYKNMAISNIALTAGQHVLTLRFTTGSASDAGKGFNLDYLKFTKIN